MLCYHGLHAFLKGVGELSVIAQEGQVHSEGIQRRVLGLAWPVIGENLLETLLGVVDTFLVAGLGAAAIAGVGTALQVMFFLISALSALSVGASVLVAQAYGAGNLEEGSSLARQSIIWSFLLSVPLAACGLLFSRHIVALFGVEPDVAHIATEYLHVSLATVVVLIALFIGGGVLRGVGDSRTPMIVTSIANVINVFLAYGLIYGHMGLPRLGAVGSAWGTFIARSIALIMLLAVLWKGRHGISFRHGSGWMPSVKVAANVMRIGVPAAMEQVMISAGFFVLSVIVAHLGTDILAAYRITFTALSFSFLPGIGFAIAATTLVGQSVGARRVREGESAARVATLWAMIWMGTIGAVLFLGAESIMGLFSQDPEVVGIGASALRLVALAQPFWAIEFVQAGAIRGTGDTWYPMVVNTLGMWGTVAISWALVRFTELSLVGVWLSFMVLSPLIGFALWRYFVRRVRVAAALH
ncbi:MATE efflux family protein [Thermobaculum terrenum ATCC BAA-798]|uniref:Probable multidrug resistance protein NorM n=1 Tax=Thermobaculum terrenum (strain ATCC BAA-798 / CCMEE 7001 / YNP1) TaxID=525904 RepID=D1CHB5_THET1|nr:MATE efflux family protein [Thermobaculum terrenum ATCC BAA-798]